ncbi:MAG: hypothetical protein ACOYEV_08090 [Candidatus Nanopelagicales bacterium]
MASSLLEAEELEALGEAEAEMEIARRYVRWASGTVRNAMRAPPRGTTAHRRPCGGGFLRATLRPRPAAHRRQPADLARPAPQSGSRRLRVEPTHPRLWMRTGHEPG